MLNDLSDHFPVFAYFYDEPLPSAREKKIFKRSFNEHNLHKFTDHLSQTNWSMFLINEDDPSESYNGFVNEYTRIFQDCFPINIIKGKYINKFNYPWLTPDLLKSINKMNRLYKQSVRSSSESCTLR